MQQPPIDLRMPATEQRDSGRGLPTMGALAGIAFAVGLAVWIALMVAHNEHAYHGDQAATPEFLDCINAEFDESITTGTTYDSEHCKPVMPAYAAHPFWYAAIVGLAAFVIGRVGLFMVRMERARGY